MTYSDDTNEPVQEDSCAVRAAQVKLRSVMQHEIPLMREMLGSMQQEQDMLLLNHTQGLKVIMKEREELFEAMVRTRNERFDAIQTLKMALKLESNGGAQWDKDSPLDHLLTELGAEGYELLWLRDQVLMLLEKMNGQHERNNYLIQHRIKHTRELMRRLDPHHAMHTYRDNGTYVKKNNVATLTLINQEG